MVLIKSQLNEWHGEPVNLYAVLFEATSIVSSSNVFAGSYYLSVEALLEDLFLALEDLKRHPKWDEASFLEVVELLRKEL
jgi:hypothetical protein